MNNIRISRHFRFEAAHSLQGYDGHCKHIHGHSYQLTVTILGEPNKQPGHPKRGMVMDFGDLKRLVETYVIKPWDHALLLSQDAPPGLISSLQKLDENLILLPYQPTCENMVLAIRDLLQLHLPDHVQLHSIRLSETQNSYSEWYASDNTETALTFDDESTALNNLLVSDSLSKANAAAF